MRDLHCALCHIFRIFQELEEVFASLLLVGGVLGQVAPRLAEEPHRDALHTLAAGSANHEVVLEWRQRARVGHRGGAAGAGGAAGGACGAARLVRRSQRERRCAAERSGDEAEAAAHDSAPKLKEMKDSGLPLQLCTYLLTYCKGFNGCGHSKIGIPPQSIRVSRQWFRIDRCESKSQRAQFEDLSSISAMGELCYRFRLLL